MGLNETLKNDTSNINIVSILFLMNSIEFLSWFDSHNTQLKVFQADLLQGLYSHSTPSRGSRGNEPLSRPRQAD